MANMPRTPELPATPIDTALRTRGMTGHLNAAYLPPGYPQFFARGDGCRLWDVDGREYIDFMCSWGPNLLGHHHPEVEAAAARQRALGEKPQRAHRALRGAGRGAGG
jgi:glutamate-1-semialdehyde aminotransferase